MPFSVLAVIVLYRTRPEDAASLRSLLEAARAAEGAGLRMSVHLFDNTPGGQEDVAVPEGVRYYGTGINAGLANAYNDALAIAYREGHEWLLTLDQDTELPGDFLVRFAEVAREVGGRPEVAAIVPQLRMGDRVLSPHFLERGSFVRSFPGGYCGVPLTPVYAFNSGALLRVSALRQVGGYEPRFWLDGSDTDLFHRLSEFGKRVHVAGDVSVQHRFAMLDAEKRVSPERYGNVLLAESAVWDLHLGWLAGVDRTVRLGVRWLRYLLRGDADLRRITSALLALRLFRSRRFRLARWLSLTDRWAREEGRGGLETRAPRISVCMAAYNGERYVGEQLASILPQLGADDEVIVVDDASEDRAVSIVRAIGDSRIRIVRHASNRGVVASFEEALRSATGDILFLSDMDDVWAPNKVATMMRAFRENPSAQIVASSLSLIDEHGRPLPAEVFLRNRRPDAGFLANILRNNFQGSTMAIRSSLLRHVLPFPTGKLFLHDAWMGTRNAVTGGDVVFLEEPLLRYRRHSANVSGTLPRGRQIRARLQLLWAHLCRRIRDLL